MPTSGTRKPRGKTSGDAPRPGGRRPVDSKTRARVVKLATELDEAGKRRTRNAIAKLVGISPSTVSRIVAEDAPEFSWADQAAAVEATNLRSRDLKAERQTMAADIMDEARRVIAKFSAAHEVIHWDKDGDMHRGTIDAPTSGDVKNYAIALGILIDKHLVLTKADTDDRDLAAVDQWLAAMGGDAAPEAAA